MRLFLNKGMTLLEVLIALFIFAISAATISRVVGTAINGLDITEEYMFAHIVADNVIAEFKISKKWPNNSWVTGKVSLAGRQWYYRYRGQNTQDANFKSMDVEVSLSPKFDNISGYIRTYLSK
ncbi:MAG: type II secretion system minor pseudopilin GspI [Succinivibrionaceae bacterium]